MRQAAILFLFFALAAPCFSQSTSAKWQVATIMAVKAHPPAAGENAPSVRYDVTLRVGNTEYVVLYVPPDGTLKEIVEYRLGMDGLVLVGPDTIKYNDMLARTREVPIISHRNIAPKGTEKNPEKK